MWRPTAADQARVLGEVVEGLDLGRKHVGLDRFEVDLAVAGHANDE